MGLHASFVTCDHTGLKLNLRFYDRTVDGSLMSIYVVKDGEVILKDCYHNSNKLFDSMLSNMHKSSNSEILDSDQEGSFYVFGISDGTLFIEVVIREEIELGDVSFPGNVSRHIFVFDAMQTSQILEINEI